MRAGFSEGKSLFTEGCEPLLRGMGILVPRYGNLVSRMGTYSHRDVNRFTEGWEPAFPKDGAPLFRGIGNAFPTDGTPFPSDGNPVTEGWGHPFPSDATYLPRDENPISEGWQPLSRRMESASHREQWRPIQCKTGHDGSGRALTFSTREMPKCWRWAHEVEGAERLPIHVHAGRKVSGTCSRTPTLQV